MAFSAGMVWDVRNGGSDSVNGGGFRGGANLTTPSAPSVSQAGTGGTVAANTYYVVVTLADGNGETPQSGQTSVTTTGTTSTITVTSPADPGSQGAYWNVYVGTASGGPYSLQNTAASLAIGSNRSITATPPTTGTQAPGVDYSQQNGVQFSLTTASTVNVTTTIVNVAVGDHTVAAADVGNVFNNTGGTATVQRLEITGVDIVNNRWTVDKAAGTSGQTLTGGLGGAFATPGVPAGLVAVGNLIFLKYNATPYSCSSSSNVAGGRLNLAAKFALVGYDTTRGRGNSDSNRPTLNATSGSMTIVTAAAVHSTVENLVLASNGQTSITGLNASSNAIRVRDVKAASCATGFTSAASNGWFAACEANACTTGFTTTGAAVHLFNCVANTCTATGFSAGSGMLTRCIAYACPAGFVTTGGGTFCQHCVSYGHTGSGFQLNTSGPDGSFIDCIAWGNSATNGFQGSASQGADCFEAVLLNCAAGGNTNNLGTQVGANAWFARSIEGFTTLTGDPFTNAAGGDFTTNLISGAGFSLRGTGYPSSFPGLSTTSNPDVGAAQHSDASVPQGPTGRIMNITNIGTY